MQCLFVMLAGAVGIVALTTGAAAQTEPVDKNFGGPYVGGQLIFGQAFQAGGGSPGPGFLGGVDLGFGIKRDTWNRIELGLELSTGSASFKDSSSPRVDVDVDLDALVMFKGGYGYSLGGSAFGFFRAGVGIVNASYEGSQDENQLEIDGGSSLGVATMVGWDAVYMANESLDLIFGASLRLINFNFDDVQDDMGTFQLNLPAIYGGLRWRL